MTAATILRWAALLVGTLAVFCCVGCVFARSAIYPGCAVPCEPGPGVEVKDYTSTDGVALRGAWVRSGVAGAPVLLWFHGNAESAGTNVSFARALARAGIDVFVAEYRGYGGLAGSPDEDGLYADAEGALAAVAASGVPKETVVLGGRSLGTGVAVELACRSPVRGLVLVSPYTSLVDIGRRVVGPLAPLMVPDKYASIDKVGALEVPLVAIHGTEDETIPADHGRAIAAAARNGRFVPVEGASHNGIPGLERLVADAVASVAKR